MDILGIVRARIGRRIKISRQEMADILADLTAAGVNLCNDCMMGTVQWDYAAGGAGIPVGQSPTAPLIWANACRRTTCISVMPPDGGAPTYHGQVRYDEPGSMHPMHRADVIFAPADLEGYDYDQIGQLRRKARRVLVVRDDPPLVDPAAEAEARAAAEREQVALRRRVQALRSALAECLNPPWTQILDDGTLEMRDHNSGQGSDPRTKPRFQYRYHGGVMQRRHLPPETVGDQWIDSDEHEWADYHGCPDNIIGDYIYEVTA
jgi:hypothetical protein